MPDLGLANYIYNPSNLGDITNMIRVIAIHGDYANGEIMRHDMGDPDWVDEYVTWKNRSEALTKICEQMTEEYFILIGYSRGAEFVRRLFWLDQVKAVIGYEPLANYGFGDHEIPKPKLVITNSFGRCVWSQKGADSVKHWGDAGADWLQGRGFHVRPRFGWPPVGHAWDRLLNDEVGAWIERVKNAETA